ncbi:hypothetical protein DZF72_01910 [Vibrio parahaemolyticus]|nr:hypothetical protein [Vibrio parahaemolyticus]
MNLPNFPRYAENTANNKLIMTVGSKISSKTSILPQTYNAFYTANSGFSRTLPHSFLTKEKQILALTFMKQIEK